MPEEAIGITFEAKARIIEDAARAAHEVNRVYCLAIGDSSQPIWDDAPEWQRDSARNGALFIWSNPTADASAQHQCWLEQKQREGWIHGVVKDADAKTHPCIVAYNQLPLAQRVKDSLFGATVRGVFANRGVLS